MSKQAAVRLVASNCLSLYEVGSVDQLFWIHQQLFAEIYPWAGQARTVHISKDDFLFVPPIHIDNALSTIQALPQDSIQAIIECYVELNVIHPFREGNGRALRVWLDDVLKKRYGVVVQWCELAEQDYFQAIKRSHVDPTLFITLLTQHLVKAPQAKTGANLDASWRYEGLEMYEIVKFIN